jgi:hypothetical protein
VAQTAAPPTQGHRKDPESKGGPLHTNPGGGTQTVPDSPGKLQTPGVDLTEYIGRHNPRN